ncbi:unnamed protein product [Tetraodon nigroviridis]|uniref:Chromosome 5 SCAF14581, whole genome shotgun sequence n=1 Tax=Tetraodon nigroviridis TaxID=99883 RepID=Q4SII6_TETNG|nr:unnamed protein product [Tetraodon nigroviridis]
MAKKGPGTAILVFTGLMVCVLLLRPGSSEKTGKSLSSLSKPIDRRRLSGFLYNISLYLQEMGAELEEAPSEPQENQLWEKLLHLLLQSEGLSQWSGRVPPRPSVKVQDLFLTLRGSPHWDWFLGLLQGVISLSERQPHRAILTYLSENWRTVSAVLEVALQALISGTYGQASAGLQGFICALKGNGDCAFSVSWLQPLLSFLETRNWKPVVSLHPAAEGTEHSRSSGLWGRLKPFSLPPGAAKQERSSGNGSLQDTTAAEEDSDSMQSLLLQALFRSGGGGTLAQNSLALVQSLDELRKGLLHRVGSSVYDSLRKKASQVTMVLLDDVSSLVEAPQPAGQGRCSVGDLRQLILCSFPFLTCPSSGSDEGKPALTSARSSRKTSSSSQTASKRKRLYSTAHLSQFNQPGPEGPRESSSHQRELEYTSIEILEAACNDSIPGLTGVSNFTVFLYCKLFEGENGSVDPAAAQMGLDLQATCSDAAWYLSAAEEDFFWVHVCSEFFAHEFNNTVCANSSFWLQRANQATLSKDAHLFNQSSIDELCTQRPTETAESPKLDKNCLADLENGLFSAQAFRRCFLPNSSALVSALCGGESPESHGSPPEESWAAAYCSKVKNISLISSAEEACRYREWEVHHFTDSTLLERCGRAGGLKEHVCFNSTLYSQLLQTHPRFAAFCAHLEAELEGRNCLLQRFFDMLPAPYEFDTSQLCVDAAPLLLEAAHKLSVCEVEGGERQGFMVLEYVLRVLDSMVGLSSGLDEGESEARQGLGQAILLSSLVDNTSWTNVEPEASTSILQTVGVFLRREQNTTLKEDLLSCFSEYLQMPGDSIRTLVMSAEKDAVKRFLSHVHQSWDQLQVEPRQASQREVQAMETMTAAFIHKFPRVTPELFVDLSQFIPFMSVSDIMSFPASLIVNDSVLTAIRDHSLGMKLLQKKAFVKRLLQSNSVGNSSLDGVRGRHVIRTLFGSSNLTRDNILRIGTLACYLDPQDLGAHLQDPALCLALLQQLARCTSEGFISESGRLTVEKLCKLKPLHPGLSPAVLADLRWDLGYIAGGMSCDFLKLQSNDTDFAALLQFVTELPGAMRPALGSSQAEGQIDGPALDSLGPLLPFLDQGSLALVDRGALALRLEEMRSFCLPKEAVRDIASLLIHEDLLGEPSEWQVGDVEHLGRLVLSLSTRHINSIPLMALNKDTVELVLLGQRQWEDSALSRMSQDDLQRCVDVFAQDASISPEQRRALWLKLRQAFGPVRQLRADQLLTLGSLVTEMSERELQDIDFTNPAVLAHLGTLTDWSFKKMRAVVSGVLRKQFVGTGRVFICGEVVYVPLCLCPGGLEDLVLSALVREQLEGITPQALALVTPKKMAVSCQCSCLSRLVMSSVTQIWAFYATNRWFSVPGSCRGSPWSRRGRSQRTSGQSWTLSRNSLSSEPDMKATSCWSSEVRAHTHFPSALVFRYNTSFIPSCAGHVTTTSPLSAPSLQGGTRLLLCWLQNVSLCICWLCASVCGSRCRTQR